MKLYISVIKGHIINNAIYMDPDGFMRHATKEMLEENDPPIIVKENRWDFGTDEFNKALAYAQEVRLRNPGAHIKIH